jgi:hypothetical protein
VRNALRGRDLSIVERGKGADSVILGCTEIGLLIDAEHDDLAVFAAMLLRRCHRFRHGLPGRAAGRRTRNTDCIKVA